ncbi:hypothetical protein XENTR_v10014363 [Xenopus tropicalis]|nr:hypothetical protein XENTR_v10014363 [Xenopus tropicalis]|eukprot:XP_017949887.1 PREDICTED: uncharacterized protein LOC105947299 [Xenopus tropicalis]
MFFFPRMAEKFMNPDFLKEFIEAYHAQPCLWRVKSVEYSNRQKRKDAYEVLVELSKRVNPSANIDFVKNKISNIRTVFKKEFNKVQSSKKSGASTDEIYTPRLWYYELLSFTVDQDVPRDSFSNFRGQPESIDSACGTTQEGTNCDENIPIPLEQASQSLLSESNHHEEPAQAAERCQRPVTKSKKRKAPQEDDKSKLLNHAAAILAKPDDELDAFAFSVVSKLRRMSEAQRLKCELLITDLLHRGLQNGLSSSTTITTNSLPIVPQPPHQYWTHYP